MLRKRKYSNRVMLLMWEWKESVLSRMTPRLLAWGEGDTVELSMVREKLLTLDKVDLVPTRRSSVLSVLGLRKFEVNQDLISERQWVRKGGRRQVYWTNRAGCHLRSSENVNQIF